MNVNVINNCEVVINIDGILVDLLPHKSQIISEFDYKYLLQTSDCFKRYLALGFIFCSTVPEDKKTCKVEQTITPIANTTNIDNVVNNISKEEIVDIPANSEKPKSSQNRKGRKTRLVENTDSNLDKE